jgi:hypothetical protein
MSPLFYLCCAQAVVLAVMGARLLKKDTTALAQFRRQCGGASNALQSVGFTILPKLLNDVAFSDVRDFIKDGTKALSDLVAPGGAATEAATLFTNMLAIKLRDPSQVQTLLTQLQAAAKSTTATTTAAA